MPPAARALPARGWRVALLLAVLLVPLSLSAVSRADDDDDDAANLVQVPSRVRIYNGHTELLLSRADERNAGIALARPGVVASGGSAQAYGEVLDASALTDLASRYRSSAAALSAARAKAAASQADLQRTRELYRDRQNMSRAQLQTAESLAAADAASLAAAQAATSALAATIAQSWGPVIAASVLHPGRLLDDFIARRQYLVAVTLPPGIVPAPAPPEVQAQLPDGHSLGLHLVSPGTTANPQVQGLRLYYRASAQPDLLSGLNLPVTVPLAKQASGQVIPEAAVIWLQGRPWIYRSLGRQAAAGDASAAREVFVREPIAPRRQTGEGGYVVNGLPPDAQVVVQGAQLLLSEEFRAQVQGQDND